MTKKQLKSFASQPEHHCTLSHNLRDLTKLELNLPHRIFVS